MKTTKTEKSLNTNINDRIDKQTQMEKKPTKGLKSAKKADHSDYFSDLKDRLDKATSKYDKLKIYNTISSEDRVRLAEYELLRAGGSRVKHRAPSNMFPPTIAGFEARTEYEDKSNKES